MENNPLISIIVPVYNAEFYLEKCINSIIEQTYENLEIILINDGSSDNSLKICNDFSKKDNRIIVFNQENKGVSVARNVGLDNAHGDYIGFVDSDDFIDKTMYQKLLNALVNNECDISICNFEFLNFGRELPPYKKIENYVHISDEGLKNMLIANFYSGQLCNKLFKNSVIGDLRLDQSVYVSEDTLFVCEALCRSQKVVFNSDALYKYVMRGDSACNKPLDDRYFSALLSCEKIIDCLKKNDKNHLLKYAYVNTLNWNMAMLQKLYQNPECREKYEKNTHKCIRKYLNFKSIKYFAFKRKVLILLAYISCNLYYKIMKYFKK